MDGKRYLMQQDKHPTYGPVAFVDQVTGERFVIPSTLVTSAPVDEKTGLPTVMADTTSSSHPFCQGTAVTRPAQGRVAAFERRYGKK